MALPTLIKTWQFNVNNQATAAGSVTATGQKVWRLFKDTLLGTVGSWTDVAGSSVTPTGWWTVSGSSDGSTSGFDAVDRWTADNKLIWNTSSSGTAMSWIVLRNTAIGAKFEILLHLGGQSVGTSSTIGIYLSPTSGFGTANGGTNGSNTSRPTAVDEIAASGQNAWGQSTSNVSLRWHMLRSSDGKHWRLFICRDGFTAGALLIETAANPVSGWTVPATVGQFGSNSNALAAGIFTAANFSGSARFVATGVSAMALALTGEAQRVATAASELITERVLAANDLSGEFTLFPIGLHSTTGGNTGRHGTLLDLYWGLTNLAESTTYPNDGTRQMTQFSNFVLPWNGSVPIFT